MQQDSANLWLELHKVGERYMNSLTMMIDRAAQKPGHLVFLDTKKLSFSLNEFEPVVFYAVDVATHLQIARLYMTSSAGSSVEFLDFITQKYPFTISEIRSTVKSPFTYSNKLQANHPFTSLAAARGILHSVTADPMEDDLLSLVARLTFNGYFEGSVDYSAERRLIRELINFLFFHNNHRALPSLGGLNPIQKLKQFQGFGHIHVFDPYASDAGSESDSLHHWYNRRSETP